MTPCYCGCPMHGGTCPHCGCSYYEPDDGRDGPNRYDHARHEDYDGQYRPPGGYSL